MTINVPPTRQELMRVKARLKSAQRGHKLMKDKRDSLIQIFISTLKETLELRKKLDQDYLSLFNLYQSATSDIDDEYVEVIATSPTTDIYLESEIKNILGVKFPEMKVEIEGNFLNYSLLETNLNLDLSLKGMRELLPSILKLIQLEFKIRKLAKEITKTRRRVSALEYVVIPEISSQIRYIRSRLEENAMQDTVRLIKMKAAIM